MRSCAPEARCPAGLPMKHSGYKALLIFSIVTLTVSFSVLVNVYHHRKRIVRKTPLRKPAMVVGSTVEGLRLQDGRYIRLMGVRAPNLEHFCKDPSVGFISKDGWRSTKLAERELTECFRKATAGFLAAAVAQGVEIAESFTDGSIVLCEPAEIYPEGRSHTTLVIFRRQCLNEIVIHIFPRTR